jgi:anti-sigma regulatory factor (Ser/Thr protein kinase)
MALISIPPQPDVMISVRESTDIATARRSVAGLASRLNFGEEDSGVMSLIVTEAASNLVKHGGGGELVIADASCDHTPAIRILALDRGRGMGNVARSFEDGYSTGSSPGNGLGAIRRMATRCDVYSAPEKGTVLMALLSPAQARYKEPIEIGAINIPYPGEEISGDAWFFDQTPARTRLAVIDGLGHGVFAAQASRGAIRPESSRNQTPAASIEDAHLALRSSRGAAMSVVDIEFQAQRATFAGAGNVVGAILAGGVKRQMVTVNGTVGHEMGRIKQYDYPFPSGSVVILHSDGISASWSLDKYPGLIQKHASVIAAVLFRDFRRTRDDATIVVAREAGAKE